MIDMKSSAAVDATLAQVGPRLRALRTRRSLTLTAVARETGISKSTLSRLESGQRRPSLELLLPLAQTYRVPLDELVGAPEVGDPRVRLKPHSRNGRTVVPLSRQPGGVQAWKIVIPTTKATPELRTHDGYEWLYVCPDGCASSLAATTSCSAWARSPSSTPACRTGSAARACNRRRS